MIFLSAIHLFFPLCFHQILDPHATQSVLRHLFTTTFAQAAVQEILTWYLVFVLFCSSSCFLMASELGAGVQPSFQVESHITNSSTKLLVFLVHSLVAIGRGARITQESLTKRFVYIIRPLFWIVVLSRFRSYSLQMSHLRLVLLLLFLFFSFLKLYGFILFVVLCRACISMFLGVTSSSCICVECFNASDHSTHDFSIYHSNLGGWSDLSSFLLSSILSNS